MVQNGCGTERLLRQTVSKSKRKEKTKKEDRPHASTIVESLSFNATPSFNVDGPMQENFATKAAASGFVLGLKVRTLKKLKKDTPTKQALDFLRKKHKEYFSQKVIDEAQIQSKFGVIIELIDKLKAGLISEASEIGEVEEEDFDFDYEDDFEV